MYCLEKLGYSEVIVQDYDKTTQMPPMGGRSRMVREGAGVVKKTKL